MVQGTSTASCVRVCSTSSSVTRPMASAAQGSAVSRTALPSSTAAIPQAASQSEMRGRCSHRRDGHPHCGSERGQAPATAAED